MKPTLRSWRSRLAQALVVASALLARARWFHVAGLASGVRLAYLLTADGPAFADPLIDADHYDFIATRLAEGLGFPAGPFWQPPLYPLIVGGLYSVLGPSLWWPRLLQGALGAATAALTPAIARRAGAPPAAANVAGILVALHGPLVFYDGELLPTSIGTFFAILAVHLALQQGHRGHLLGAGLACGLGALTLPPLLALALPLGVWVGLRARTHALLFLAPIAVLLFLSASANHARGGEWALIANNGGVNLWLGNNADAARTEAIRPGRQWEMLVAEPSSQGINTAGAQDAYFARRARSWCASAPGDCAMNLVRKARLFFAAREIPRNEDLSLLRHQSPVLRALTAGPAGAPLPYVLLLPLGAAGLFALARRREGWVVASSLAALAAGPILFFVTGRYRAPLAPLLCVAAAMGLWQLLDSPRRRAAAALALAVLLLAAWPVRLPTDGVDLWAETWFAVGGRRARLGDDPGAVAAWRRALARRPDYLEAGGNLGLALERLNQPGEAVAVYRGLLRHHPEELLFRLRLPLALLDARRLDEADRAFGHLEQLAPVEARLGLAQTALARGDVARALSLVDSAERLAAGPLAEAADLRERAARLRTPGADRDLP